MKSISLRISDLEKAHLEAYCQIMERTQSDILRQYIRSLSVSGVLNPIDSHAIPPDADALRTARGPLQI